MTCHDHLRGLPAVSSLMPLHVRLRDSTLTRDPNTGHWIGSVQDGLKILDVSFDQLNEEQRAILRTSLREKI